MQLSSNGDFNLDTGLNIDDDLLNDLGWCIEINQTLVDSHLESIPGLRSFTARGLTGGDLEGLGWQTNRALDTEILGLGALDELLADLLKGGDISAGQGDADFVSFWAFAEIFFGLLVRHCDLVCPSRLER